MVPDVAQALYIGGGFPEEFAARLAENEATKRSIRFAIESGLPTLAECGGFMYLTEEIINRSGEPYSMVGVIPGRTDAGESWPPLAIVKLQGLLETS